MSLTHFVIWGDYKWIQLIFNEWPVVIWQVSEKKKKTFPTYQQYKSPLHINFKTHPFKHMSKHLLSNDVNMIMKPDNSNFTLLYWISERLVTTHGEQD